MNSRGGKKKHGQTNMFCSLGVCFFNDSQQIRRHEIKISFNNLNVGIYFHAIGHIVKA